MTAMSKIIKEFVTKSDFGNDIWWFMDDVLMALDIFQHKNYLHILDLFETICGQFGLTCNKEKT